MYVNFYFFLSNQKLQSSTDLQLSKHIPVQIRQIGTLEKGLKYV